MFDFLDPEWMASPEGALVILAMSELVDGRCPKCSSKLVKIDDKTYFCEKCKIKYKAE